MLLRLIEDGKPEIFANILHPCRNCKDSAVEESGIGQFAAVVKAKYNTSTTVHRLALTQSCSKGGNEG